MVWLRRLLWAGKGEGERGVEGVYWTKARLVVGWQVQMGDGFGDWDGYWYIVAYLHGRVEWRDRGCLICGMKRLIWIIQNYMLVFALVERTGLSSIAPGTGHVADG